jgi:hypothetical protein
MTNDMLSGLLVALKVTLAGLVAAAIVTAEPVHAHADRLGSGLGRVQEDDPAWLCTTMGDRVCGPQNSNGVTPGCYDDRGALVAAWPCHVVVDAAGNGDIYTSAYEERRTA